MTVYKVIAAISANAVDVDLPYPGNTATGGRWYGTCLTLLPEGQYDTTSEVDAEGRINTPDYRHIDVQSLFVAKQKTLINDLFLRHGPRHIGLFDECSFRHGTSAAATFITFGSYAGETTDQTINRVGQVGDWLQSEWCRKLTANVTSYLTKDSWTPTQRTNVINRWGGLLSEGACLIFDRSQYQMKGPDGFLDSIAAMLSGGARYYYQPQDIDAPEKISSFDFTSSGNGTRVQLTTTPADSGLFPTEDETTNGGHNHSGSLIGIYGHSIATLNGVHRVRSRESGKVTLETRYFSGSGSGGKLVYSHYAPPLKITAIANNGSNKTRVTTEFPHNIPVETDELTEVRVFGYTNIPNDTNLAVKWVSPTQFDLTGVTYNMDPATGICFFCRADHWHWLGLCYLLWQSGKALEYSSGSLSLAVNTPRAYLPKSPVMSPDGAYSIVTYDHEANATHGTRPKGILVDSTASFTDAVLGEQLLFTSGLNVTDWRRIVARTATSLTVDFDFANNIVATDKYVVGATATADPTKLLHLTRSFNGGTRRVNVYPQKCGADYVGF